MVAPKDAPRNLTTAITLLEDCPKKYFPLMLESVGHCADADSYLLIARLLEDLHPAPRAECARIAARKGIIFPSLD